MKRRSKFPIILALAVTSLVVTTSCGSKKKKTTPPTTDITTEQGATTSVSGKSLSPIAAKPGEIVKLSGEGFNSGKSISAKLTGLDEISRTVPIRFISAREASFVMPEGLGLGLKSVTMVVNGKELTDSLRIVADSDANVLPILIVDQSEVCSTLQYIDKTGATKTGAKDCAAGSVADCAADGTLGCKTVAAFPPVAASLATAANIKSGVTLAGVLGTFAGSYSNCSSAGEQACVVSGAYFAGTACAANGSACYLPTYALSTQDKKAIDFSTIDATKMLTTSTVSGVVGTIANQGSWALTAAFPGAGYYSGVSAAPSAGTIATSTTILGVAGSATLAPADCAANAAVGCVTTTTYKSGDLTNLTAGNIKNGTTIAGVAGLYPNATYTLPSAGTAAGLTNATFYAKVKSATAFEYWTEAGAREQSVGDANITAANIANGVSVFGLSGTLTGVATAPNAWDVRVGTVINGVTGLLKVNCRNRVRSAVYNYDTLVETIPNVGVTTGTVIDYWDTIDDYNNGVSGLPTSIVTAWGDNTDCGGVETEADDANVWKDVTTAGTGAATCAGSPEKCTMKDKITGLWWSKIQSSSQTWSVGINTCDALTFNGQTDWRLPTQKELMEAYTHGVRSAATTYWITEAQMAAPNFWSGSSVSYATNFAWYVTLAKGNTGNTNGKTNAIQVVCVR